MYTPTSTRAPHRSALALLAVLIPGALVLQALAVAPSQTARARAAMQHITIRASAPQFPNTFTTGLLSMTLVNDTKSEVAVDFGRANPGQTRATITALTTSNAPTGFFQLLRAVTFLGGPDDVLPGTSQTAVLRLDAPGLYGGSIAPANGPGHGFFLTVGAGTGTVPGLPTAGVSATLKDFKFVGLPTHLAAGATTFQLTNTSVMVHEMQVARLDPGKTQQDLVTFLRSPQAQNGPPPAWIHDDGGMSIISPHQSADVTVNLVPGYYLVVCFMPDVKKHGEPHAMEGMIGHFTVS